MSSPDSPVHLSKPSVADFERLCALVGGLLTITRDDGTIEHVSPSWERTLGWPIADLVGRPFVEFLHPDDVGPAAEVMASSRDSGISEFETRVRTLDGSWCRLSWRAELHSGRWFCVAEDITLRRELEHDVIRDPLTGVLNRAGCLDRLAHALARAERNGDSVAVLFIDLDGFKVVNDSFGHSVGDAVLSVVATRLGAAVRRSDSLARLGGDEFVVVAEDVSDHRTVESLVERIRCALAPPIRAGGGEVTLGASIGIVVAGGGPAAGVLREADVAMYRAKGEGRNRAVWFDDALREAVAERVSLGADLRGAAARGELRLHYQPLVSIADQSIVGCEALVRWQHPQRGLLPPAAFLTFAEQDGDIVSIGEWVLQEACRQQRRWRLDGADLQVSVNVSARELADRSYPGRVAEILKSTGVDATSLALEVTETDLLRETADAARALGALKRLGVRIALDDFGRGYSSLEHLKALPVDVIKIDRSFVAAIDRDDEDRAIVAAVVALARNTGRSVIAEGVETQEQLRELYELQCPLAQGYYFGRPAPAAELDFDGFLPRGRPGVGDPYVIREFMRQIGIPARIR